MAEKELRWKENVEGQYYVDENCIASKYCVGVAPAHFKMSEDGHHAYIYRQPENDAEKAAVRDAFNGCPVNAIGDDGTRG